MIPNVIIVAIYFLNYGYDESGAIPLTMKGGHASNITLYNFLVSIRGIPDNTDKRSCVGSIISTTYVITAASCVYGLKPKIVPVRVGFSNTSIMAKIHIHQFYEHSTRENDISLLRLQEVLTFNTTLGAIGLLESREEHWYAVGNVIRAIGFDEGGNEIRVADLKIVESTKCEKHFGLLIFHSRFCAKNVNTTLSREDEGSPVTNGDKLIGIVSLIKHKSTKGLSVIVKGSHYIKFIEDTMNFFK